MSEHGYDKQRFPNLLDEAFDCVICSCIVKNPKQCSGCGKLFCSICIDAWKAKNSTCPMRCNATNTIDPIKSKVLMAMYNNLEILCDKRCNELFKLSNIEQHEKDCTKEKCLNKDLCNNIASQQLGQFCSNRCLILMELLETKNNIDKMYHLLLKYGLIRSNNPGRAIPVGAVETKPFAKLRWNNAKKGERITLENDSTLVFLKEQGYTFRSAFGNHGFIKGAHYWEIIADKRTENELKIGIAVRPHETFNLDTAFCDDQCGFAFYGLAQLRHGSNASGPSYGKRFKKEGTLGVFLDMNQGTLSFGMDGLSFGVAFTDVALKTGPIYPAVALLHCAGCTITDEKQIPACFLS